MSAAKPMCCAALAASYVFICGIVSKRLYGGRSRAERASLCHFSNRDRITAKPSVHFSKAASSGPVFRIDDATRYQEMIGFGASCLQTGMICINSLDRTAQSGCSNLSAILTRDWVQRYENRHRWNGSSCPRGLTILTTITPAMWA
jgi:hypothetical protein